MPVPRRWLVAACAMTLPSCAGCLAPYSYSPYGSPYGYPGTYSAPGTFPGGVQSVPSETYAPTPNGSSAANSGNTDAPMFDPNAKDPNPVPNYPDPGDLGAPPKTDDKNMFDGNKSPFDMGRIDRSRSNPPRTRYDAELATNPAEPPILKLSAEENSRPAAAPTPTLGAPAAEPDAFLPPQQSFADADELKVPYEEDRVEVPFGYDTQKYLYLRGLVNYDDRSETWSIIYDNQPDRDDEYGGVFTLLDHPGFAALNNNDVVYVEGKVSADQNDEYGKPKYQVEKLTKLQRTQR